MWYFSWILGTGFACSFAILNAIWLEVREFKKQGKKLSSETSNDLIFKSPEQ